MSSFFIRRPIFAIVISIIIVILGALSLLSLPIAQYPQISPPTVNLSTTYTGANATIVNQTVAQVIEDQLKGVDDMSYMSSTSSNDGSYSLSVVFSLDSDANALDTITEVKKVLDQAKETFPPDLDYTIVMDNTNFINASINEVKDTFVESLLLVILVVFVFLQKWRTTLIPVLAVPVSIVGTFASFKILDFTINTLTLFAMVLAIGLVVDDAIVVIENVEEHMSKDKLSAKDATEAAMKEVQGPIIATTAVLASIFIPVAFIGGVTGVLYKQFAVTITISVVISACVALTLTPALCGVLLKPGDKAIQDGPLGAFFRGFNGAFDHFKDRYTGKVGWMIHHLKYAAVFLILVTGLMGICYRVLPSTFVPDEDQGVFMASITMPEGTSLNQTIKTVDAAAEETRQIPGVKDVMTHAGGSTSNTGNLYVALENWDDRQSNDLSAESIIAKFNKTVVPNHPEARVAAFNPSSRPVR